MFARKSKGSGVDNVYQLPRSLLLVVGCVGCILGTRTHRNPLRLAACLTSYSRPRLWLEIIPSPHAESITNNVQ
jgi:hypothetical protein